MQTRASRLEVIIFVVLFLIVGGGYAFGLYGPQFASFFRGLEPSCSIRGFGATVTVQGWSANSDCQAMLYGGANNFTGVSWTGSAPASDVDGMVVCEYDMSGRHVTVRGDGVSDSGAVVCGMLDPIMPLPTP